MLETEDEILVKEIAIALLEAIKLLPSDRNLDVLTRIEADLALKKLRLFLHRFTANSNVLTMQYLKQFSEFLSERWYYINHTDSCYPHHPYSKTNLAYLTVARFLYPLIGQEVYMLLMPTICALNPLTSRRNLSCFKLHEFVLGDDGTPIEVRKCLDQAAKNHILVLFHTGDPTRPLNENEKHRVINHSIEANDYYAAIKCSIELGIHADLEMAAKTLHETLEEETYQVTASYGQEGRRRQAKAILSHCKDREEFLTLMTDIPKTDWREFFRDMDDDDLRKMVLGNETWLNVLQKKSAYTNDINHNKALLFCLAEIYKRDRLLSPESKNFWGYFPVLGRKYLGEYSKFMPGFTREDKLAAVEIIQDFLLSNKNLDELETYLTSDKNRLECYGPLFEMGSDLCCLSQQIDLISDPKFFVDEPRSGFFSRLFS